MRKCLLRLHSQLKDFNTAEVKEAADAYRSRGIEDKAANLAAIDDHLRELRQQKRGLEAEIVEKWKARDPDGFAKKYASENEAQRPETRLTDEPENPEPGSGFALKGETESEIRTREAQERAKSEQDRAEAAAPSPAGFLLTGSDRQVDEAEARGQESLFAAKKSDVPFSRKGQFKRGAGKGINVEDGIALAKTIKLAYPIRAVESKAKWPDDLLRDVKAAPHSEAITAAIKDGEVWLDLSAFNSLDELQHTILHEGMHGGWRGIFGDDLDPALMRIYKTNAKVREKVEAFREQFPDLSIVRSTEEVLVDMGASGEVSKLNGWRGFVATVKDWLRKHGFTAKFLEQFTDDDVAHLLSRAARVAAGDAKGLPNSGYEARFSRNHTPDWADSAALKSATSKVETYAPGKSMKDKVGELKGVWKERLVQGLVDQYAPLKRLGPIEYVRARMTKSADTVMEGLLLYGKPVMDSSGTIQGKIDHKGFLGAMQDLKGEHDRFFMWIAGNRAAGLMGEGREHLFTPEEVKAMQALADGKMADGSSRKAAYSKAAEVLRTYNKAVLDIAEQTGLIETESRKGWERDFYVPFFRVDEDAKIEGPSTKVKGLVRQQAFKRLKGGTDPLGDLMANTLRNWSHILSASMANQAAVASLKAAEKVGIAEQVPDGTPDATYAMVNGQKQHYLVNDPAVLTAISALENVGLKGLPMKVLGKFKHYLTLGVTVSPTFRIRNLLRDSIAAIGQNEIGYNPLSNVYQGWKATDRKGDDYAKMLFNGALIRFGQFTDGKHAEHAKRLIESGVKEETILTNPEKVKAALGKLWDEYQEFGDRMENVNRAALYKKLTSEGMSDIEAAFAARDMMDFSMQGSWMAVRFLSQTVPFMNARLQGLYKMGRAAHDNPKRLGYVVGAVALASVALLLAYGDDDEWKKREDWDRDAFWWFKIGNTAYRIPKPFEIGALGTIAERSAELMLSDEMNGKRFAERMRSMIGDTFAMNPTPQLFKPMIDLYSNKDSFTGRMIETRGMEKLSKSERATPYTTLVAKMLGKAEVLSPVQIDHVLRGYFGWLGAHAAMTADVIAQPFMDKAKPARRLDDYFVVGDFVKELPSDRSRYVEQFYKQAKAIDEVMGDLKQARESKDSERVREILKDKRADVSLSRFYDATERRMSEINKQIRSVHNSSDSAEVKREKLDKLNARRNALAKLAEQRATRARESAGQ